jgi:GT2 family glycosyltransferase
MPAAPAPRVCVVIISYNSSATLPRCLDCLAAQTYKDFHLTLIDNASQERPARFLSGLGFPTTYLEMKENLGFAQAMNVGIEAASSPLIAALNPDAFANPDWLETLVAAADRHAEVAAFGSMQISAADDARIDGFGDHYLVWGQAWRGRAWPVPAAANGVSYCFGVCAAAALYRTDALRRIGGFDRRFFCFYEDIDVSFRLRLAGHECAVVGPAVVRHVGGASFEGQSSFAEFLIARNQWWVLIKNMPLLLLILVLPGYIAMQLYAALRRPRSPRMKGLRQGLLETGAFIAARREIQASRKVSIRELCKWLTWSPSAFLRGLTPVKPAGD